ncbi:peptidase M52 [Asanoa ishikariensis]|uniref:Hydrogenase maturation protease n=1 Tax=Asanoa ishikariensis TaxID=137265 RepID=A0A1H3TPY0_9ACTN|nr:hydrogenase maturation protease [Asanoa ishikariensis]GIF62000.1 peptidase M52 [Asanoa ishikariensis]SDZ52332.1 hydrogenase maturation protease [Asanoa ishikariensis]
MSSVLVAGIGNVFLGDDGFGPAVAQHLVRRGDLPDRVRVVDYGIRGLHLAYDLLNASENERSFSLGGEAYDSPNASKNERSFSLGSVAALILIDALPGDDEPGTVTVLEVGTSDLKGTTSVDAHAMDPATVLATVRRLGGTLPPTYVVGCRPAGLEETIGLSPAVAAAVPEAAAAVDVLLGKLTTEGT